MQQAWRLRDWGKVSNWMWWPVMAPDGPLSCFGVLGSKKWQQMKMCKMSSRIISKCVELSSRLVQAHSITHADGTLQGMTPCSHRSSKGFFSFLSQSQLLGPVASKTIHWNDCLRHVILDHFMGSRPFHRSMICRCLLLSPVSKTFKLLQITYITCTRYILL